MVSNTDQYNFFFGPNTLFIEMNDTILPETLGNIYRTIKESFPNTDIKVVAYKNLLGYWAAYSIENDDSIYCGTMSLKDTREKINKYLKNDSGRVEKVDEESGI